MFLAAITFADPLMLAGLLAALVPIVLHLLNRMRAPVIPFPTLRFLKITAQKTARRRQIQQYFLLLIRVIVFALVAMAVAAPLIHGGSPALAYGFVGILLVGLGLLVLALVLGASAYDTLHSPKSASATTPPRPARLWTLSLAALLAALLLGGYSLYGMVSDRFFASNLGGEFSGQSTAMVVIFDNSHSMLARNGPPPAQTRLDRAKYLTKQLLGEAISPRQAAILPTNPGLAPTTPTFKTNMFDLAGNLEGLTPTGSARPIQERIRTALDMLRTAEQPSRMLIIVSDFARPNFSDVDVFASLKNLPWRQDLQIVLLPIRAETASNTTPDSTVPDVGITSFTLAEGTQRPVVGAEVTFEAQLINNADTADVRDLLFSVDGQPLDPPPTPGTPLSPRIQLGPAGSPTARATVRIPYRLTQPGIHRYGVQLPDQQDALAWDDARELVLDVADQVRVLVVGAEPGPTPRPRSAAFYFQAALAPFDKASGAPIPWPIKPTYHGIDQVQTPAALQGYSAVFLCDIPRISSPLANALATYAQAGGRIIWILGPSVDSAFYNQTLLGIPSPSPTPPPAAPAPTLGLLPAPLAQPLVAAKATPLDWVDLRSGLFMNLFESEDPFRNALITGHWTLADASGVAGRPLAKLADGTPIFIQHAAAGTTDVGRIYTLLTTPAADWSNLGATVLLVPLASRMALGDFQETAAATAYETGQSVPIHIPALDTAAPAAWRNLTLDVTTPSQAVINVKASPANAPLWLFDRAMDAGIYTWKSSDSKYTGSFVVNPPGDEADLLSADLPALAKESSPGLETPGGGRSTIVAYSAPELLTQLQNRAAGTSLTPGFLALVLMLAVVEALLSNRHKSA